MYSYVHPHLCWTCTCPNVQAHIHLLQPTVHSGQWILILVLWSQLEILIWPKSSLYCFSEEKDHPHLRIYLFMHACRTEAKVIYDKFFMSVYKTWWQFFVNKFHYWEKPEWYKGTKDSIKETTVPQRQGFFFYMLCTTLLESRKNWQAVQQAALVKAKWPSQRHIPPVTSYGQFEFC